MNKKALMQQLADDITTKNICPDLAESATNLVVGDGNLDAEIVFIGEAPGKNEDEQGLPFVGAAGKFLNEMLAQAGMDRGDVYITNIVKYRPPDNRDPLPDEKKAFWPYLLKQLQVTTADRNPSTRNLFLQYNLISINKRRNNKLWVNKDSATPDLTIKANDHRVSNVKNQTIPC
ncbi:MAG: uracil-DNA glycosylase [Chloroflexi bacterium]|nr:MAG: uracil-DNA glycosylase [Chloroflexota bacterium]